MLTFFLLSNNFGLSLILHSPKSPAAAKKPYIFLNISPEASTHIVGIKWVSRSSGLSNRKRWSWRGKSWKYLTGSWLSLVHTSSVPTRTDRIWQSGREAVDLPDKLPSAGLPVQHCTAGPLQEHHGYPSYRPGKDIYCICCHVQLLQVMHWCHYYWPVNMFCNTCSCSWTIDLKNIFFS